MTSIELPLADATARDRIKTELDRNFFVEAGAGSGKTRALVERMAALIQTGNAQIHEIVAVTFTRKAAAELKERLQLMLETAKRAEGTTEAEKDRLTDALGRFEQCFVGTIHAFCAKLLRERPVEAGLDPAFEEMEEKEDLFCADAAWYEYVESESERNPDFFTWLTEHELTLDELHQAYRSLIIYPDVKPELAEVQRPDLTEAKKAVKAFAENSFKELPRLKPGDRRDSLMEAVEKLSSFLRFGLLDDDGTFISSVRPFDKDVSATYKLWLDKDKERVKLLENRFNNLLDRSIRPSLVKWAEYLHRPAVEFVRGAVGSYADWRKRRSLVNFHDLLLMTAELLREKQEVRRWFQRRVKRLLVDEFQDTDPVQAEIMFLLTAGGEDKDWRAHPAEPGALFVVGDPKQSIYRFRRADISVYDEVRDLFAPDEILTLNTNFRSLDPIVTFVNEVFTGPFGGQERDYQAPYISMESHRTVNEDKACVYKNRVPVSKGNNVNEVAGNDAQMIASWIDGALHGELTIERSKDEIAMGMDSRPRYDDFLILTRTRKRLRLYAQALEQRGIPCDISGGGKFSKAQEVQEILKVLKAVANPSDPVALIVALRGDYFGLSDDALYHYKRGGGAFTIIGKEEDDDAKGESPVEKALARLAEYRHLSFKLSPAAAIDRIVESLGAVPMAASQTMGSTRAGNIFKAQDIIRQLPELRGGFADTVSSFAQHLEAISAEESDLSPGATQAVRVMNVHKAKGLEAPVVFLADPLGPPKKRPPRTHISRRKGEDAKGYFVLRRSWGEHHEKDIAIPPRWAEMQVEETNFLEAEKLRLEYVAATRAKNMLVVSTYEEGKAARAWESLDKLKTALPSIEMKFDTPSSKKKSGDITPMKLTGGVEEAGKRIAGLKEPTYDVITVTESAKQDLVLTGGVKGGQGWGRLIHEAIELCGQGRREGLEAIAKKKLANEGRPPEELSELLACVDSLMASELWKRAEAARERYFELPFSLVDNQKNVINGTIDLIFKEDDGWVVVDFKTDDYEADPKRKEAYERQIEAYAEYWAEITGEKVKETMLWPVG